MATPMITIRATEGDEGVTIHVQRGRSQQAHSAVIGRDALLSFGGDQHFADAKDLVRAVVGEVARAVVDIQNAPKRAKAPRRKAASL